MYFLIFNFFFTIVPPIQRQSATQSNFTQRRIVWQQVLDIVVLYKKIISGPRIKQFTIVVKIKACVRESFLHCNTSGIETV